VLQVRPIFPKPSVQPQPSHHADDIGAMFGEPSWFNELMSATEFRSRGWSVRWSCAWANDIRVVRTGLFAACGQNKNRSPTPGPEFPVQPVLLPGISWHKSLCVVVYTRQSTGIRMRFQFLAAAILGLSLSPMPAFGCTCSPRPPEVKTTSELAARTKANNIRR
jgi:hypothetical protein